MAGTSETSRSIQERKQMVKRKSKDLRLNLEESLSLEKETVYERIRSILKIFMFNFQIVKEIEMQEQKVKMTVCVAHLFFAGLHVSKVVDDVLGQVLFPSIVAHFQRYF